MNAEFAETVATIEMLGSKEQVIWTQGAENLMIKKPIAFSSENVIGFKVTLKESP